MVAAAIISQPPQKIKGWAVNIVEPAAFYAPHVIVMLDISVESGLAAAKIELVDHSEPGQQLQVAIHGPEADFGHFAADKLVQPHGGRVRSDLLEFLQNHLSLPRHALIELVRHSCLFYY
jgi:hypothetical protein